MPRPIVAQLNADLLQISGDPDIKDRLAQEGLEPLHTTPAEFTEIITRDIAKWAKVVKAAKITSE
jgi:tripartite-type tricarboxylate transporter receptor subunit TctC